jgi:hypothetical protein
LHYQLLTATAGTLLEAMKQHSTTAILVIHEFRAVATGDEKMERNARELNRFLQLLLQNNGVVGANIQLQCGQLMGPVSFLKQSVENACGIHEFSFIPCRVYDTELEGGRYRHDQIQLFVGKISTDCKSE